MKVPALKGLDVWLLSGGFQTAYERGFANGLAACGARVTLVGSDQTDARGLHPGVRLLNLRGSQSPHRPAWAKALNLVRYYLLLWWRVTLARPQAVHMFGLLDPPLLAGVVQGAWLRLVARCYVLTAHNLLPHDRHTAGNRRWYGLAYRLAHRCVVHTPRMAADLARMHGVQPDRIVVMEHGIEPLAGRALPEPVAAPDDRVRLLCFGVVARYKGVDLVIEAMRVLPPHFTLHIAGFCRDASYRQELRQSLQAHPAAARMRWDEGYVPEEQVPGLFARADALVLAYRHIDQSGALFQAMRHGMPVVASRVGSFGDYVTPECGMTYDPANPDALASTLLEFSAVRMKFNRERILARARGFEWPQAVSVLRAAYLPQDTPSRSPLPKSSRHDHP